MRSDLVAQIDLDALRHNYRLIRAQLAPGVRFCAPLKADAYGHGVRLVAPVLHEMGADYAAVATVSEAVELRQIGWNRPILVLGNVLAVADPEEFDSRLRAAMRNRLTLTIADESVVQRLDAQPSEPPIEVHLKLDTGMGRMGVMPEDAAGLVRRILACRKLRLVGIYSHLATADLELPNVAHAQIESFSRILSQLGDLLPRPLIRHLANSAATLTLPQTHLDMVRPGLAMYGYSPAKHVPPSIDLKPILQLLSHLTAVKQIPANHGVGYGHTFVAPKQMPIGIVPVGYFDGYIRALSNNAFVSINGQTVGVIGRVSMDQMAIDLSVCPAAKPGDPVVLIDNQPDSPHSVASIAHRLDTIPYEVTCLLGRRIERISVGAPALASLPNS